MKKITKLLLLMVLFISTTTLLTSPSFIKAHEDDSILHITDNLAVNTDSIEPLYNTTDELIAYYFEGNQGYAIIGVDGTIIEFSDNGKIHNFDNQDSQKSYYLGVGEYFIETDDKNTIADIFSDEEIKKDEGQNIQIKPESTFKSKKEQDIVEVNDKNMSATITYPDGHKDPKGRKQYTSTTYNSLTLDSKANLPYNTRYFSYNTDGTCGSTASAIMMYYYYDHIGKSYITNHSYIGTTDQKQKAFVNHFKTLLGDNGSGTGFSDVKNGINSYLSEVGKSKDCTYITDANVLSSVISKIKSCINNKKPCIIDLDAEPTYGEHWVVGVGYASYYGIVNGRNRGYVHFVKVNNGWYDSSAKSIVYVNYKHVGGLLYIK